MHWPISTSLGAVLELSTLFYEEVPLALTVTVAPAVSDAEASMRVIAITLAEIFIAFRIYKNLRASFI